MTKSSDSKKRGIKAVAEMFNVMDDENRQRLMKNLAERDPALTEQIQRQMFVFDDFRGLSDKDLQTLFRETEMELWLLALRKASQDLKEKLLKNVSATTRALIREEMDVRGLRKVSEVQAAQEKLIEFARKLAQAGKITLPAGKT